MTSPRSPRTAGTACRLLAVWLLLWPALPAGAAEPPGEPPPAAAADAPGGPPAAVPAQPAGPPTAAPEKAGEAAPPGEASSPGGAEAQEPAQLETAPPRRNYLIPAVETLTLNLAIWGIARISVGHEKPDWSVRFPDIFTRNPFRGWLFDKDDFDTNQFLHPFHGTLAFTSARSSGIDFWTSILYPFGMSLLWELVLETQNPSPNDQITTTVGGTFLGEGLYRLASLVLYGGGPKPAWWRYLAAFPLSPMTVFNRLVFGDRYASDLAPHPTVFGQYSLGAVMYGAQSASGVSESTGVRPWLAAHVTQYGVDGWRARLPFDHFDLAVDFGARFSSITTSGNAQYNLFVRGLLVPARVDGGPTFQGLWGLFGGYDYSKPGVLRVSTGQLGPGLTGQWELGGGTALQGTAILSWVILANADAVDAPVTFRGYHIGPSAQALLDARLLVLDRLAVRATARQYVLSGSIGSSGWTAITTGTASILGRIFGGHSLVVEGELAYRSASYPGEADRSQRGVYLRVYYSYVSDEGLGSVPRQP